MEVRLNRMGLIIIYYQKSKRKDVPFEADAIKPIQEHIRYDIANLFNNIGT